MFQSPSGSDSKEGGGEEGREVAAAGADVFPKDIPPLCSSSQIKSFLGQVVCIEGDIL